MKTKSLWTWIPSLPYNVNNHPSNVTLDVTYACNHRCGFCYNQTRDQHLKSVTKHNVERILVAMAQWGVMEVLYLGGEPSLFPSLGSLIRLGRDLGLRQRMVSNGANLTPHLIRSLKLAEAEVGITLHSHEAPLHDSITGVSGSHAKAVNAIGRLVSEGVSTYVQFTLTKGHSDELRTLALRLRDKFSAQQLGMIDMTRLVPQGFGKLDAAGFFPSDEEIWNAMRSVPDIGGMNFVFRTEAIPHCWLMANARADGLSREDSEKICSSVRPCLMGIDQLAFDPLGRMKLCPCLPPFTPSVPEGRTPQGMSRHFQWAWENDPILQQRRAFRFLPEACIDVENGYLCQKFYKCVGGCRAGGGFEGAIPDRLIRNKGFIDLSGLSFRSATAKNGRPVHTE